MGRVSCYLDIETTGFSPHLSELTVLGLYVVYGPKRKFFHQPYGEQISSRLLKQVLSEVDVVYTYNGTRFDLPFIEAKTGIAVDKKCRHEDLMHACWERGLFGGLKAVERLLKIPRASSDIDGWMAVELWHRYRRYGDKDSLRRLLAYNREDAVNLSKLRSKLFR